MLLNVFQMFILWEGIKCTGDYKPLSQMLILSRWLLEDIKDVKLLEKVDAVVVDDVVVL